MLFLTSISFCVNACGQTPVKQTYAGVVNPPHTHDIANVRYSDYTPARVNVIGMRKFPYPYQAMLAISSDADHETLRKFNLVHQFINTTEQTPLGKGLGLDISDSFFMYNGSDLPQFVDYGNVPLSKMFTYFSGTSTKQNGAKIIDHYIHTGWLDTIHTFGDFSMRISTHTAFNRKLAKQAISALKRAHDGVIVWTNHGNESNVDNFGAYGLDPFFNYQQGANPKSPYYHTDLSIPYGIKFVWTDVWSAQFGHSSMIYPLTLPDGRKVWGFYRYTSLGQARDGNVIWIWSAKDIPQQMTLKKLQTLERSQQYAILAQHFYAQDTKLPLTQEAVQSLRILADQYRAGKILVARTSRLLTYNVAQQYLKYNVTHDHGDAIIHLTSVDDPVLGAHAATLQDIRGVTFYTSDPRHTMIELGNRPLPAHMIQYNPSDGRSPSISVKWYPPDTKDYSETKQEYQPGA